MSLRVEERQQEERNVGLPGDAAIRRQVNASQNVTIAIGSIGDQQLVGVDCVVHVPAAADN